MRTPEELEDAVQRLREEPDAFVEVQAAGREQAERFRASLVYPELIGAAIADVEAAAAHPVRVGSGAMELAAPSAHGARARARAVRVASPASSWRSPS